MNFEQMPFVPIPTFQKPIQDTVKTNTMYQKQRTYD